ncbi:MAG TPA: hypothetical protein VFH74_04945 [Gaiellales bacterium]|nr:hypothetical protein [Gaiellales bacterium]
MDSDAEVIPEEVVVPARQAKIGERPEQDQPADAPPTEARTTALRSGGWAFTGRRPAAS